MTSPPAWVIERQVISLFCETLFQGIFTILAAMAIFMLWRKREKSRFEKWIIPAMIVMYCASTVHLSMRLASLLLAVRGSLTLLPTGMWVVTNTFEGVRIYIPTINLILGDTIVIWRVYAIWNCQMLVCVIPGMLLCCVAATGITGTVLYYTAPTAEFESMSVVTCGIVLFSLCAATNIISTVLIAVKAWRHRRLLGLSFKDSTLSVENVHLRRPFALAIESGALYSSTWIILLACLANSPKVKGADSVLLDILVQLTGIYPAMIVVVVCMKHSINDSLKDDYDLTSFPMHSFPPEQAETLCTSNTDLRPGEEGCVC